MESDSVKKKCDSVMEYDSIKQEKDSVQNECDTVKEESMGLQRAMGELQNRLETLVQKSSQLEAELKNQKKT
jgi:predicted  nucleic acid-binding Zn-ribbon protein